MNLALWIAHGNCLIFLIQNDDSLVMKASVPWTYLLLESPRFHCFKSVPESLLSQELISFYIIGLLIALVEQSNALPFCD